MMMRFILPLALPGMLLLLGCSDAARQSAAQPPAAVSDPAAVYANPAGIDRSGFDTGVRPQDDFFEWVNGGWVERTAIPPDRTWWGVVPELRAASEERQRAIIEEMAARDDLPPGSVAAKVGAFFASLTEQRLVEVRDWVGPARFSVRFPAPHQRALLESPPPNPS